MSEDPDGRFAAAPGVRDRGRRRSRPTPTTAASRTGCGASPTRAPSPRFQQRARRSRRRTSRTGTTATRPRCAIATRSRADGEWTFGYFTPLDSPGHAGAAVPPPAGRGPVAGRGARRSCGAPSSLNDAPDAASAAREAAQSTMPYAFALAEPGGRALVAEALPEAEDLLPAGRARRACARSTPTSCTRSVLPRCWGSTTAPCATCTRWRRPSTSLAHARCRLALLLRATPVRQIVDVAEAKESMPAKSTFFHPKLPVGPGDPPAARA